jgi:5-methylcytosine-specific restriction endonuclease McrA
MFIMAQVEKKLHDFDWLWEQKWELFNSEREIADKIDVTHPAIGYWCKKYNIDGRVHPYISDPEILHHLYIIRDKGVYDLSDKYDVDKSTISKMAKKNGFSKTVHRTNLKGLKWAIPTIRDLYWEEGKTLGEIAEALDFDVTTSGLRDIMESWGIDRRRTGMPEGEEHPHWKGGSVRPYGVGWKKKRNEARQRDDYQCQICGVGESRFSTELDVHHIVPYREFEDGQAAHSLDNLVSLCSGCHAKVEWGDGEIYE